MNERFTYVKPRVAFAKDGVEDHKTGKIFDFTIDNVLDMMNELSNREERLLDEIEDFQQLLSKNDKDSYRLGQISFAITVLNELKKELKE